MKLQAKLHFLLQDKNKREQILTLFEEKYVTLMISEPRVRSIAHEMSKIKKKLTHRSSRESRKSPQPSWPRHSSRSLESRKTPLSFQAHHARHTRVPFRSRAVVCLTSVAAVSFGTYTTHVL